jgi:hypothetical protein
VPLAIIDSRIHDLAKTFWDDPDRSLMLGYRRLEEVLRTRLRSEAHSKRLFTEAFLGENRKLEWPGLDESEQSGRASYSRP